MGLESLKKHKKLWITLVTILAVLLICTIAVAIYISDDYPADKTAAIVFESGKRVEDCVVFDGDGDIGFVFYPGGKVEAAAYAPLMQKLSKRGITCVLVEMPLKLAVLDAGAWEEAIAYAPGVKTWYIGGHSLGGAMASSCDPKVFAGVVLLAAYPTDTVDIPVLSLRGTEDKVLDMEAYREGLAFMKDQTEVVIEGGNHAQFGYYGLQDGDGTATITREEQIEKTVAEIAKFVGVEP